MVRISHEYLYSIFHQSLAALLFLVCFGAYFFNEDNESIASVEATSQKSDTAFQSVDTMELKIKTISPRLTLPGRVYPIRQADVRPQVDGIIIRRLFQEGSVVKKGQQLYQIDDARFKAVLNRSIADLKSARPNLKNIETRAGRYKGLVEIEAISQQEFDNVIAELQQARATLSVAQAAVDIAQINLDYTKVYAPISGRIGRSFVTEGALVTENQSRNLATITQLDRVYIDMQLAETDAIGLRRYKDLTRPWHNFL